jgi:zinc D-Ala-D-Ala carboxypeptidase
MKEEIWKVVDEAVKTFFRIYPEEVLACHHCGSIIYDVRFIFQFLLLQESLDEELKILSYYRCPEHNRQVGGAKNSRHLQGRAIDIVAPNLSVVCFIERAKNAGMTTILYYPSKKFFHIDNADRAVYIDVNRK